MRALLVALLFFAPASAFSDSPIRVVFLGDSLTDGYGLPKEKAYPQLIQKKLGPTEVDVVNASISGSTSASAEGRLKWLLKQKPQILVLALGANDGLRGVTVEATEKNLSKTIELAQKNKIHVLLAGMTLPLNYGKSYIHQFEKIFSHLAKKHHIPLIPFLLKGVGGMRELNQEDGIHPNEAGQEKVAENVLPELVKVLEKVKNGK